MPPSGFEDNEAVGCGGNRKVCRWSSVHSLPTQKKHLKLLKRDEILRGRKAQHSGKSASESNIITAVHQIYICMLELIGTRFLMEKRLFYPSRD